MSASDQHEGEAPPPKDGSTQTLPNSDRPETKASADVLASLLDAALALEPELRTLNGVLVALRYLGERGDPIEPAAIAVLATTGENALAKAETTRREMEEQGKRGCMDER
jgi:hypothetical protein